MNYINLITKALQRADIFSITIGILLIIFYNKIRLFLDKISGKIFLKSNLEESIKVFIKSIINIGVNIILVIIIVKQFGFDLSAVTSLVAGLSIFLGFAFKEIIGNFGGGLILIIFKPFKIDDIIEYKGITGVVKQIELFYTTIVNFQGDMIIMPNGLVINTEIKNITRDPKRRLDLVISVGYNSNIEKVKNILNEIAQDCPLLLKDTKAIIGISALNTSSIDFAFNVYVSSENYANAKFYLLETVKMKFDENNIEIPYPQLDLHMRGDNNGSKTVL
ncbi:mechanosensitive ion channel family protein [Caviibacter abscessus]|uniref:mechanosensitive ion channel family protein n=1 Tax=Caviibacter abscessus TaxID=1766719 RepID=UPI0008314EDB|nr:mechanosensitive ion channel domain-containing protein [Caviibacter abscessus]